MKYLSLLICIALLITAIVFMPSEIGEDVNVGKGNGTNAKLKDPQDIQGLLQYVSDHDYSDANSDYSKNITKLSYNNKDNNNNSTQNRKNNNYKSVTIHETAYITFSTSTDALHNSQLSNMSSSMNRQLSIYMTNEASYYHSVGQITTASSSGYANDENIFANMYCNFNMEIYVEHNTGKMFIKFNRWNMVNSNNDNSQVIVISDEIIGRWVSLGDEGYDLVSKIDGLNRDSMNNIGQIIGMAIDKDLFDKNKGVYSLSKNDVEDLLDTHDLKNSEFIIDMSNAASPKISMQHAYSVNLSVNGQTPNTQKASSHVNLQYTFENINNTIVSMDKNVDILEIDHNDIEDYIYTED